MKSRQLFLHAAEQWVNLKPASHVDAFPLMKQLEELCDPSTNLYIVDMQGDDPMKYALHRIVENVNLRSSSTLFGDYPDQAYMRNDVAPAYQESKVSGAISKMTLTSRIQDQIATYDRVILPALQINGASAFAVTLSKTRILLPVERRVLTGRDEDVLDLLAQGFSSKEIALKTNASFRTVEHRIASVKAKLQAKNVTHAVAIWMSRFLGVEARR
ncbi:response regulator transcription factor [Microvirga sp. TS319]